MTGLKYPKLEALSVKISPSEVTRAPTDLGGPNRNVVALSEPYQHCSRSSDRIRHIDSGLVMYISD